MSEKENEREKERGGELSKRKLDAWMNGMCVCVTESGKRGS